MDERGLAPRVQEHGDGVVRGRPDGPRDVLVRVEVGRERHREARAGSARAGWRLSPELRPTNATVAAVRRDPLQDGELRAARAAPRRPLVDHDRVSAQRAQARAERRDAALEQLAGLRVQRRERRGRARELRLGGLQVERRGRLVALLPAACSSPTTNTAASATTPATIGRRRIAHTVAHRASRPPRPFLVRSASIGGTRGAPIREAAPGSAPLRPPISAPRIAEPRSESVRGS